MPSLLERNRTLRWLLLALTLALSAYIQFTVVAHSETKQPLRADAKHYFSYAYNLKHLHVYSGSYIVNGETTVAVPDSFISPGYPVFLASIPGLAPTVDFLTRVERVQAFLGVLSVLLVYLIAANFMGPGAALAAALVTALNPHLASISTYILTESLFLFLMLSSVYASLLALRSGRRWALLGAGLAWGICSFVRPTTQFLPPLFLFAALALPAMRQYRLPALLIFAGFFAAQAPWIARNQLLPHGPPQKNLMVDFLHHGSYPNFMYHDKPETYGFPYEYDPDSKRVSRDLPSVLTNIARHFREEPLKYANWYLIGKPGKFLSWGIINGWGDIYFYPPAHSPYMEDTRFKIIRRCMLALHWPLMLLGLAGALLVALRPQKLGLDERQTFAARIVAGVILYAIAFHMIGAPFPRYGIPFRTLLYMLAALLVSRLAWRRVAAIEATPA